MTYGTLNVDSVVSSDGTTAGGLYGFKNRIINGAMVIDQRNAGASVSTSSGVAIFTLDRWQAVYSQTNKFTVQQNAGSVTPPNGFRNYLGITSSSAYSVGASELFNLVQGIEGFNAADFGWGTANAQAVTLSFWVRSSLTGTFGVTFNNESANRFYGATYTVSAANTWEQKTVTISGDTSGTWVTNNGLGIAIRFGLGVGASVSGAAGSWGSTTMWGVTGATSVVGTSGATFYITGVQLEKGSTATSFDYRPYGTELSLCQRYYYKLKAATNYANFGIGRAYSTAGAGVNIELPVPMRAAPTGSTSSFANFNSSGTVTVPTNLDPVNQYDTNYRRMTINVVSTFVSGQAVALNAENTTSAEMSWSAEL
jgi:hypothetical protein